MVKRETHIDFLRGLGILSIVFFHTWVALGNRSAYPFTISSPLVWLSSIGFSSIHLFLILSGYGLYKKYETSLTLQKLFKFYKSRFVKFSFLYYLAVLIYLLLTIYRCWRQDHTFANLGTMGVNVSDILKYLLYINNYYNLYPPFWFIAVLMQLTLLFPFILFLIRHLGFKVTVTGCLILALFYRLSELGHSNGGIKYLPEFLVGIILAQIENRKGQTHLSTSGYFVWSFLAILGFLSSKFLGRGPYYFNLGFLLAYTAVFYLTKNLTSSHSKMVTSISKVGAMSYSIYLFHTYGIDFSFGLLKRLTGNSLNDIPIFIPLLILGLTGLWLGMIFFNLFEKKWARIYAKYSLINTNCI